MTFQSPTKQSKSSHVISPEYYAAVAAKIEAECFPEEWAAQVETVIRVMMDVFLAPDSDRVRIGGIWRDFAEVKEAYKHLTHEDVDNVIRKIIDEGYRPVHIEAYYRTALFNEAREAAGRTELALLRDGLL